MLRRYQMTCCDLADVSVAAFGLVWSVNKRDSFEAYLFSPATHKISLLHLGSTQSAIAM